MAEPSYSTPRCLPFHLALARLRERFPDATPSEIAMWCMPGVLVPKQWVAPPAEKGELPAYIEYTLPPGKKPRWIRFRLDEQWRRHDPGQSKWDVTAVLATASFRAEDIDCFIPEVRWLTYFQAQERWEKALSSDTAIRALLEAKARAGILTVSHPVTGFVQSSAHHHRLIDESDSTSFPPIEYAMFVLAEIEALEAGWQSAPDKTIRAEKQCEEWSQGDADRPKWPWGSHETKLLRDLAAAANKFWKLYDPSDPTTAPTNEEVRDWLMKPGVAKRNAEVMATILRANGLPSGPRK